MSVSLIICINPPFQVVVHCVDLKDTICADATLMTVYPNTIIPTICTATIFS